MNFDGLNRDNIAEWLTSLKAASEDNLLAVILAICIFVLLVFVLYYRHKIRKEHRTQVRQRESEYEVASRRRISPRMKQAVLERDNYTCQICGISQGFLDELCPGLGDYLLLETDHIRSVKRGGSGNDIDNLQCLCWRCNRKKGGNKTNRDVEEEIDYGIWHLEQPW